MRYTTDLNLRKALVGGAVLIALSIVLSGCSSLRQAMGIDKVSPDEFAIVTKAPLVIPPDYNLRPPAPGTVRDDLARPQTAAQIALFGPDSEPVADGIVTAGEFALLSNTGAERANPNIRAVLNAEAMDVTQKDRRFTDQILFWRNEPTGYDRTVVDAGAEADRIRDNQAIGRPITDGETPTITKDRGIF